MGNNSDTLGVNFSRLHNSATTLMHLEMTITTVLVLDYDEYNDNGIYTSISFFKKLAVV